MSEIDTLRFTMHKPNTFNILTSKLAKDNGKKDAVRVAYEAARSVFEKTPSNVILSDLKSVQDAAHKAALASLTVQKKESFSFFSLFSKEAAQTAAKEAAEAAAKEAAEAAAKEAAQVAAKEAAQAAAKEAAEIAAKEAAQAAAKEAAQAAAKEAAEVAAKEAAQAAAKEAAQAAAKEAAQTAAKEAAQAAAKEAAHAAAKESAQSAAKTALKKTAAKIAAVGAAIGGVIGLSSVKVDTNGDGVIDEKDGSALSAGVKLLTKPVAEVIKPIGDSIFDGLGIDVEQLKYYAKIFLIVIVAVVAFIVLGKVLTVVKLFKGGLTM